MTQGFISTLMCIGTAVFYAALVLIADQFILVANRYSKDWTRPFRLGLWLSALIFPVLFLLDHVYSTQLTALLLLPFQVAMGIMILMTFGTIAFDLVWWAVNFRNPEDEDYEVLQKSKYVLLFEEHNSSSFSRKTIWRRRTLGVWAAVTLLLSAIGILRTFQNPEIKTASIDIAGLPENFQNLTITHLSDLHLTPLTPKSRIESLVKEINASKSDLVVLTGDMFQTSPEPLQEHLAELKKLSVPPGVFVVPGHLERYWNYQDWKRTWLELGWTLLENSGYNLYRGNQSLCLIGRDLRESGWIHLSAAPEGQIPTHMCPVGAPKILITHEVQVGDEAQDHQFDLVMAGDTMGGQFWPLTWYSKLTEPIVSGEKKIGNAIFSVTAGMGFWLVPLRIGSPPEYSRLTLMTTSPARAPDENDGMMGPDGDATEVDTSETEETLKK
ncbi:MAG: metallophosphoesterase [Bdellovibrionales bacterium]|nr:metallophosphoesterase [Bdellovibrionales bacterium]